MRSVMGKIGNIITIFFTNKIESSEISQYVFKTLLVMPLPAINYNGYV